MCGVKFFSLKLIPQSSNSSTNFSRIRKIKKRKEIYDLCGHICNSFSLATLKQNEAFVLFVFDHVNINHLVSECRQALEGYIKICIQTRP